MGRVLYEIQPQEACKDCPFIQSSSTNVTFVEGWLEGIVRDLMNGMSFTCHNLDLKSVVQEHCAGALQYLEREERQMD